MIVTRSGIRKAGWLIVLAAALAALFVLSLNVNAIRSEVRLSEQQIVKVKREMVYLETEFETLANQQQLRAWNDLEFGYVAPSARQYLEGERALAELGQQRPAGAPKPVRVVAAAGDASGQALADALEQASKADPPKMVNPVTGKAATDEPDADVPGALDARLIRLEAKVEPARPEDVE